MRIYKLRLNVQLIDAGEAREEAAPQDEERRHPMLEDPQDRQERMVDKVTEMMATVAQATRGTQGAGSTLELSETYDCPVGNFDDVMHLAQKFHDLANLVGTPASPGTLQGPFVAFPAGR